MNFLLKKMLYFDWARQAYVSYLNRKEASLQGKYLFLEAKFLREGFEKREERPVSSAEMLGIYHYLAFYAQEVLSRINDFPEQQQIVQNELSNINIGFNEVKEEVPDLTAWQFQHFKLQLKLPDFERQAVPTVINKARTMFQVSVMGILAERFQQVTGRLPGVLERVFWTPEDGPVIVSRRLSLCRKTFLINVREN